MIQKYWFCVALFFSTAHPAYSAQRSERVKRGNSPTFLGDFQIIFPAFENSQEGDTEMKSADCTPNATICFELRKIKWMIHQFSPHILNWMVVMLNLFLCFFFNLFLPLNSEGVSLLYTPQYQYLKAVSLMFCPHILNVCQYFIQKLPCPSNCQSVGDIIFFSLSFKEMQILLLIKSKQMHTVRRRFVRLAFLF